METNEENEANETKISDKVSFSDPSINSYDLLKDKQILISDRNYKRLIFLCDNFKLNLQHMAEYLIKREYKYFMCCSKLIRKDPYSLKEKQNKREKLVYEISTNGDVIHYVKFLKEIGEISKMCKIITVTSNDIILIMRALSKKKAKALHNIVISYYPFEAIRREDVKSVKGLKWNNLYNEIIRVGRIIQILKDQGEINKTKLIRSEPVLPKTDEELYEEILSWG